jgi:hypothetical protein
VTKLISQLTMREVQEQFALLRGDPIWDEWPSRAKRMWAQLKARERELVARRMDRDRVKRIKEEVAARNAQRAREEKERAR